MNFKKTLLFFLIFAFIGTYFYLIEIKKTEKTKQLEQEEKRVFSPIKKDEIVEVTIEKENEKTLRLTRENNRWKIKGPVEAEIDADSHLIWLDYLEKLPSESTVTDSLENLAEYGLDKPTFSIKVKADNGSTITFQSGDEIPTGNSLYSKLKDKNSIFLIATYNKVGVDKTLYDLRDKKVFHFKGKDVHEVEVSSMAGNYTIERKDADWQVTSPKTVPANFAKISSLLQNIQTTIVKKFVDEDANDLAPYGLEEPGLRITYLIGKNKTPHTLLLGDKNEEEAVYAKTASANKVFLLNLSFLKEFPLTLNDVRDKSVISFDQDRVYKVQFLFKDTTITAEKNEDKDWEITEPQKAKADNYEVNKLLEQLAEAKVQNFIPRKEKQKDAFALSKPRLTVKIFEMDDSEGSAISFGADYGPTNAVFASTGAPDEVLLIEKELFGKLNISNISLHYKNLMTLDEDKIAHIQISAEGKEFILSLKDEKWTLNKPEKRPLPLMKAKEVIWTLGDIEFFNIIDKAEGSDLSSFGLDKPVVKIILKDDKQNQLQSLFIGSKAGDTDLLYATTDKSKTIYSIKEQFKEDLLFNISNL